MIGEQGLQKAGEVRIEQLKLINSVDEIIDLTEFVVELNIYEDIFKNYFLILKKHILKLFHFFSQQL